MALPASPFDSLGDAETVSLAQGPPLQPPLTSAIAGPLTLPTAPADPAPPLIPPGHLARLLECLLGREMGTKFRGLEAEGLHPLMDIHTLGQFLANQGWVCDILEAGAAKEEVCRPIVAAVLAPQARTDRWQAFLPSAVSEAVYLWDTAYPTPFIIHLREIPSASSWWPGLRIMKSDKVPRLSARSLDAISDLPLLDPVYA